MTFATMVGLLGQGFMTTLWIFLLTLLGSLPLGLLVTFGRRSKFAPLRGLVKFYISIMRGTPLMLQLIVVFFCPNLLFGLMMPSNWRFSAVIVAFVINYAAYFAEIYRGGIESIPKGQYEAGQVLGMTKSQVFFRVVLLQVIKRIIPSMGNEIITLVKDTALARIIAVYEVTWAGESFIKKGLIWPLFYTGVFYLLFSGALTVFFGWLEKKLNYFRG